MKWIIAIAFFFGWLYDDWTIMSICAVLGVVMFFQWLEKRGYCDWLGGPPES
jgi:hypothetical protein